MPKPARSSISSGARRAYRNNGQQTSPAAKIIANVQKNFFFIGPLRPFIMAKPAEV
jgi:hypothetical protein